MSSVSLATFDTSSSALPPSARNPSNPLGLRVLGANKYDGVPVAGNKVLLLEDDPAFKEIMTNFFEENGYEVTAVKNGVEGLHHVLAGDFELILCDMMMPTLPGDMFYRAVERMRPHLCSRFVFMTGHRENQRINAFIESVSGTVLNKPFRVFDLLEMIDFVRLRATILVAA